MTDDITVEVIGAGVAGLCSAFYFAQRGCQVTVLAASDGIDHQCCSWWAGGMLAPWCEMESAEALIGTLGIESMKFWREQTNEVSSHGSLVLANERDRPDLNQFAQRTECHEPLDAARIETLEPDLKDRFSAGLFYQDEAHLNPRKATQSLLNTLADMSNVTLRFGVEVKNTDNASAFDATWRIDCRGLSAKDQLPDLRGVRGEMLLLRQTELTLHRPVRLLHPRYPLYVVPREDHVFMVGATMIESEERGNASARSIMELLSAAYALHPAFGEAIVLEIGCDARPAFPDNLPRIRQTGKTIRINGLFRHGYLCAPAMARRATELALDNIIDKEVVDEYQH